MLLGAALMYIATAQVPYIGTGDRPDLGNLHINATGGTTVFIDGVDVLQEIAVLRQQIARLMATAAPTTTAPTTDTPTASPSTDPPTGAPTTRYAGLPSWTAAGHTVFRLPASARPSGTDHRLWYRDLCVLYGLRPVMCANDGTSAASWVDDNYDLSGLHYMGVGLPYTEFQCSLVCSGCPINANTRWAASHPLVAYNQREYCAAGSHACTCYAANGCLYETDNARSQVVHPICTNSTG